MQTLRTALEERAPQPTLAIRTTGTDQPSAIPPHPLPQYPACPAEQPMCAFFVSSYERDCALLWLSHRICTTCADLAPSFSVYFFFCSYSMYPSSYYRFRQQQAGAGAADEAAAGLPRFAQRGGEMAGAEAEADAAADVHASEAAMLAAAHGRRAAHWSQWAGAGAPEGGDAAAAQLGADAAGGASSAAAAAAAHMMAPLPPGLMPSSAYSPGQRAARLAAMRAELDQRMIALKALHEKRVAAAAAAAKAGSGAPAGAAAAAEAAADAAEEERLAREIDAAMAMPAELEGAGMPPMPAAPGQAQEKAQETAQGKGQAPAASSRGFVRPRIVQHMPAHA